MSDDAAVPTFEPDEFPDDPATSLASDIPDENDGIDRCLVCGTTLTYGGRGRRPKYCADHKPSRSGGSSPRSSSGRKGSAAIRAELQQTFMGVGMMLASVDQYDAAVVVSAAPQLADTLTAMADKYPEFRKFLENGNKSVVWLQLSVCLASVAVPIMAHHGLIPIDEREAFVRFHGDPNAAKASV